MALFAIQTSAILLILLLRSNVECQGLDPDDEQRIDDYMEELMECRGMPGAILAIATADEVLMAKGYGLANIDTQEPVTADTLFAIASVTKSFTATLLAKVLADTEGVDWNTPVRDILGEDFFFEDGYRSNQTTNRDLLAHKTGIPRHDSTWTQEGVTREELVMEKMRFFEPVLNLRTSYMYNNLMYAVAGTTAEVLRGNSYEDLLTEELMAPIGMTTTTFYDRAGPDYSGFVQPYCPDPDNQDELIEVPLAAWRGAGSVGPAASVCSTANDMALWLRFVLSRGTTPDGDQLIDPLDMERLWVGETTTLDSLVPLFMKPRTPITDIRVSYGLAYSNSYYREYQYKSHGGDLMGFHSQIFLMPDMDFGIFFSTNYGNHSSERYFIQQHVADILLGVEPWATAQEACDMIEEIQSGPTPPGQNETTVPECPDTTDLAVLIEWLSTIADIPDDLPLVSQFVQHKCLRYFKDKVCLADRPVTFRPLEDYEGQYGHFAFGNLTVFLNDTTGLLELQYGGLGRFDLYPTENEDMFIGQVKGDLVFLPSWPVNFTESDSGSGLVDRVTVPLMEIRLPPTFERGLTMDQAPPPRIHDCM